MSTARQNKTEYPTQVRSANKSFYPISLDEIEQKVARKNGRRSQHHKDNNGSQSGSPVYYSVNLDNIKEIANEFGE